MEGVILTIRTKFKLFKKPRKIGDAFEFEGKYYLIIGIEHFEVVYDQLTIWYTCQNLAETDYISKKKTMPDPPDYLLAEASFKYNDEVLKNRFLGTTHDIRGERYKIMEYRDISVESTDISIVFSIKPIYPISRKEAKAKSLNERKKKLQLEIF